MPPQVAEVIEVTLPLYFFGLVFAAIVMVGLLSAPYQIYKEEREKREAAEFLRRPKLSVSVPNGGRTTVEVGATSETHDGRRYTAYTGLIGGCLSIQCRNTGETALIGCIARLTYVRMEPTGEQAAGLKDFGPLILPWDARNPEQNLSRNLAPGEMSRVEVARITPSGHVWAARDVRQVPLDYHHIFGGPGTYRCVVQLTAENSAPVEVLFEFSATACDESAKGLKFGRGTITFLAQASPQLAHEDIAA